MLLYHVNPDARPLLPGESARLLDAFTSQGYLGVDLFFVLSGFVISYNYGERFAGPHPRALLHFWWMRFARLWPVHATMLLAYAAVLVLAPTTFSGPALSGNFSVEDFARNVFLVHAWSVPIVPSWNGPAWSVSCEWLAYLLFPLLCLSPLLRLRSPSSFLLPCMLLLATAAACQFLGFPGTADPGIIRVAGEFTAGCCVFRLYELRIGSGWKWPLLTPLLLSLIFGISGLLLHFNLFAFWVAPFLALLLLGTAYHRCHFSRLLSLRPLVFVGTVSYSIYMVHELCLIACRYFFPIAGFGEKYGLLVLAAWLVLVFIAGIGLYVFVEKPSRNYLRKMRLRL